MSDIRRRALNIFDLRKMAQRRLPHGVFAFIDRGSGDDVAIRDNRAALERIKLRPRVLVDVSTRSQATTLFGQPQSMPLVIAPTGPTGLMWHRGEIELARAIEILHDEIHRTLAVLGCASIGDLHPDHVIIPSGSQIEATHE